ncbi:maleylacetate reductase [Parasphingopyxis algicola]|nr:maleylacetate reductase [Parasphingopyxis algicola]
MAAPDAFSYRALPTRVIFGRGARNEADGELRDLDIRRPFVVASTEQSDTARQFIDEAGLDNAVLHAQARMHTPVVVTDAAHAELDRHGCDGLVAIGGGSAIGLSKALAARTDLPQLILPTTYAGSEMTDILGETDDGEKRTRRSPSIQPETVIYDVELTLSLPVAISVRSGINAIAHAVEGLYAHDANPVSTVMGLEAIRLLKTALPAIANDRNDLSARSQAFLGSHLAAGVLGMVSMSLHHKLCHILGGTFDLPHAAVHSIMLPYTIAYNSNAARAALAPLENVFAGDIARGLFDLNRSLEINETLADLNMREVDIDQAVRMALANPYSNPAELEASALRTLFKMAVNGEPPGPSSKASSH